MELNQTVVSVQNSPWTKSVEFLIHNDKGCARGPLTLEPTSEFEAVEPTFKLTHDATQQLMDALWRCGFRPTEGTGSAGALKATQNHLDDLRKILFHRDGISG